MSTPKPIYVQYAEEAVHARHNRNFQVLASAASNLYNHFVHDPKDYINIESPLAVGSIFASCLGYLRISLRWYRCSGRMVPRGAEPWYRSYRSDGTGTKCPLYTLSKGALQIVLQGTLS